MAGEYPNQYATPLFEAIINYAKGRKVSFHTPGHKHGVSIPQEFRNFVGEKIFDCDLTLLEEVDSLHDPRGVIKEAQRLAAKAYGADYAFFLLNGTSGGNHAMILTVCDPGDKIIIPRNTHRSVLAGVVLSGTTPVYVMPERDEAMNMLLNVTPEAISQAIREHPDAKAVLVTHPTYEGIGADVKEIGRRAHEAGMFFLVDEAHGPHLKFHRDLPVSAMDAGADICVQSSHKIISSLTQTSLLLARRTVDVLKLKRILSLLMTTSPSYILMASLDLARMQMATRGRELLSVAIMLAEDARQRINQIQGLSCFGKEIEKKCGANQLDVTKLCVRVAELGLTGYQVAQELNRKHKIQVEYADLDKILLIISIGNTERDVRRLLAALEAIARNAPKAPRGQRNHLRFPERLPEVVMSPRAAVFSTTRKVPLKEAVGKISAEVFSPYPPGIPLLNPGERISAEILGYLRDMLQRGGRIQGQSDPTLRTIKIVEQAAEQKESGPATLENQVKKRFPREPNKIETEKVGADDEKNAIGKL
ncbi:aminotransferase class I/II-fold pyridoxal phosphate-dependent enzyme [candidate division FCPU426 bacterium]|nr:aminotransferase class I/II-fold pyridoxal phosphate-dependent enzyme [candidate division FCPU426 bacterium]